MASIASVDIQTPHAAIRQDQPCTVHAVLTITPAEPKQSSNRPPLNLSLVLDRSGSMEYADKMDYAKKAAAFAVQQLAPTDRVSVVTFDNQVDVLVPSTLVTDKPAIQAAIQSVHPRGGTALHAGWAAGHQQVLTHRNTQGLNRVLLLSDGQANAGITDPDRLADVIHEGSQQGVSTTTLGLGNDYHESLMQSMAQSGDGNYYYITEPSQLEGIFQTELQGLALTTGTDVVLRVSLGDDMTALTSLNQFEQDAQGRYRLPNLIATNPLSVVFQLTAPASATERRIADFQLEYTAPGIAERQVIRATLTLPAVSAEEWEQLPTNTSARAAIELLNIAYHKSVAHQASLRGDVQQVHASLNQIQHSITAFNSVCPAMFADEEIKLQQAQAMLDQNDELTFRKTMHFESHQTRASGLHTPSSGLSDEFKSRNSK